MCVGRAPTPAAVGFDLDVRGRNKVKGDGQECPSHTNLSPLKRVLLI